MSEESTRSMQARNRCTINLDSDGLVAGDDIPDEFKCPICFEVPQAEIYQCKNGHTICTSCHSNIQLCPQCRVSFQVEGGLIRNRVLETLVESMILPCPFKINGCLESVSRKTVKMHRINCIYNGKCIQLCKILGYNCDFWTNTLIPKQAVDHFYKHHKALIAQLPDCDSTTVDFEKFMCSVRKMRNHDGVWTPVILSSTDSVYFMILTLLNSQDASVSWHCLRLNQEKDGSGSKFEVEFHIESQSRGMPALEWKMTPLLVLESEGTIRNPVFRSPAGLIGNHYVDKQNEMLKVTVTVTGSNNSSDKQMDRKELGFKPPVKVCEITARNQDVSSPIWAKLSEPFKWVR